MTHVEYLFSLEQFGIKLGLAQISALVAALGHPDRAYRSIVVAGTNGKGSVTAMIDRGLRAAGYRTGRYTSPHLIDLSERMTIDGRPIGADVLEALAGRVRAAAESLPAPPSFFEATTAVAIEAFRDASVDFAVLEVGLGGRLDATNVVAPAAVAITAIAFDHESILGRSLAAIAAEKAGVIKPGAVVVAGDNPAEARDVIAAAAAAAGAELVDATRGTHAGADAVDGRLHLDLTTPAHAYRDLRPALRGRHQVQNIVTAVRLLETLDATAIAHVPVEAIRAAVEAVEWPARLQMVAHADGDVLIDGAHNPAGAQALARYVAETYGRRPMVVGIMADKNIDEMIAAFAPAASHFVFTAAHSPRAARPSDLLARAASLAPSVPAQAIDTPDAALTAARPLGTPVVVAGSLYLAGEILAHLS
jgi:dihydrofolate synthase/folylpolyglutamate synthase